MSESRFCQPGWLITSCRFWMSGRFKCWGSSSTFQLSLELVEETPIRSVGEDLVGGRLDKAGLAQPQRIESNRVVGVALPPLGVRNFLECLERVAIVPGKSCIDELPRHQLRLVSAKLGGFDEGAQNALRRNRMLTDIVAVSGHQATEILRPWAVCGAVEDHMADVAGAQLLRLGRKTEKRVDLPLREQFHRLGRGTRDPPDILCGIEPDMGGH